jgi:hypothetical protein
MNRILFAIALAIFYACGAPAPQQQGPQPSGPQPTPTPTPNPGGKTSFADASAIMQKYCVECHATAPFTKSEQALVASSSKNRVQNSTMPPPYATQMAAGDKQKFLSFF